ncbi:MAG TPA: MFS transporter [Ferruginibacter sp.]|nr:MFS transporter [Ferruginibacter sp.]
MFNSTIELYKKAYSGLTKNIWLLSIVMLVNRSGTMVLAFLTLYCKKLGYSTEQGGWVVAIYGLGSVVGALLGGKLSDQLGFYKVQFGALFFGGILFILLGQMNSYTAICICTFVLSMINETFRPANATAIAHYSNKKNRTQSFSLVRLAINMGWGVGIAVGGFLASIDYHLLFWVDGFTNIGAAIMLLIILPKVSIEQQKKPQEDVSIQGRTAEYNQSPLKDKEFLLFLFFVMLFALCFFQLFTTVPIFMKENLGLGEAQIGTIMAFNGVLIALIEMLYVYKLEGRRPYLFLITIGTLLMGIAFSFFNLPFTNGFTVAVFAILVLTFAEMTAMPFMNSYYISKSSELKRGHYAGLYTMAWSVAQVFGSSLGAIAAEKVGFSNLWWIVTMLCLLSAGGFYFLLLKKIKIL